MKKVIKKKRDSKAEKKIPTQEQFKEMTNQKKGMWARWNPAVFKKPNAPSMNGICPHCDKEKQYLSRHIREVHGNTKRP